MNVYDAIMKAAATIENDPKRFDFGSVDFPDCGSPSCALGWIGHYLGFKEVDWHCTGGLDRVTRELSVSSSREFYSRMNILCGNVMKWRDKAKDCAATLRLYAAKYHAPAKPTRTDAELVSALMARVTSGERIPEDA